MLFPIILTTCILISTTAFAQSPTPDLRKDLDTIANRLRAELTQESGYYRGNRTSPSHYIQQQNPDGSWPDIDYTDRARTHWAPSAHPSRLRILARAYRTPGNELEGNDACKNAILSGLNFWVIHDPQSDNWWFNVINVPGNLADILLLMQDAVPDTLVQQIVPLIHRSGFTRTGANLVWEAGNLLTLACATRDTDLLKASIEKIAGEIRITTEEGIQPDFSFHQHGPQLYMANYGAAFASDNSRYAALFAGTAFAFPPEKIQTLSNLILEGQQWFLWGRQFDYHALGRQLDTPGASWSGRGFRRICTYMIEADPAHAEAYKNLAARTSGEQQPEETGPTGNRNFFRSDVMVQRGNHFYASVRMHSTRVYATEVRVNSENLKGYYLSDGVYFLMQRGDEYHDIQPVWDWRKLPGLTTLDQDAPYPYGRRAKQFGNTAFVGGVSDGHVGMAVMDYDKDGVRAHKAYFFQNDGYVCLGAGITAASDLHTTTAINQCLLKSDVLILKDGKVGPMTGQHFTGKNLQAVYHDSVGYYMLTPQQIAVSAAPQTGTWTSIEERSTRPDSVTQDVFSLWIDHGPNAKNARYAYRIMPGIAKDALASAAKNSPVQILSNTPTLQAVYLPEKNRVQAAFFDAGALKIAKGQTVQVDTPCLLMQQTDGNTVFLSVSDPAQTHAQLHITLNGRYTGDGCTYDAGKRETVVAVNLPAGDYAGRSVGLALRAE